MRKLALLMLPTAALLLAETGVATAGPANNADFNFSRTFQYDPGKTACPDAQWVNGAGRADSQGKTAFGLVLAKNCATSVNAAAGAVANGVKGSSATVLGFDLRDDSPCGGGAPRFNLLTEQGTFHFIGGCANGLEDATPLGDGWTRYQFQLNDPTDAFPVVPPGSTIAQLEVITDEQGSYRLDNLRIDGQCTEKPGQSRPCAP